MDIDIRDEIDRALGEGPPGGDLSELLTAGRRALRRRRFVEGASAAAVVVVVGGAAALAANGPDRAPEPAPPAPTSVAPSATPSAERAPQVIVDSGVDRAIGVQVDRDGLHVNPFVRITYTDPNPWGLSEPRWSAAIRYTLDGTEYWFVGLYVDGPGGYAGQVPAASAGTSFTQWLADQQSIAQGVR